MSSVVRRIIIEEYVDGGYGIHNEYGSEIMGLSNEHELIKQLMEELEVDMYSFEDFVSDAKFFKGKEAPSAKQQLMSSRSIGKSTIVRDLVFRRIRYETAKNEYEGVI